MKLLDLHKQKPELGFHPLAELFKATHKIKTGKSQIAKSKKNEFNIRRESENLKVILKKRR